MDSSLSGHPRRAPEVQVRGARATAARAWLIGYLAANDGRAPSAAVRQAADLAGYGTSALHAARRPGIRIESVPGVRHRTTWVLTDAARDEPPAPTPVVATSLAQAQEWLSEYLGAAGGHAPSRVVKDAATRAGHRPRTVARARAALGVRTRPVPGPAPRRTEWALPPGPELADDRAPVDGWLAGFLISSGGRADSALAKRVAGQFGYGGRTLGRACRRIGVRSENVPGAFPRRTVWVLDAAAR